MKRGEIGSRKRNVEGFTALQKLYKVSMSTDQLRLSRDMTEAEFQKIIESAQYTTYEG